MKIGIESTSAFFRRGGIDNYTYNLIANILAIDKKNNYYLYKSFVPLFGNGSDYFKVYNTLVRKFYMFQSQTLRLLRSQYSFPPIGGLKNKNIDIFHCTDHTFVPIKSSIKKIITIHDLSFLFPENEIVLSKTYIKDMYKSIDSSDRIISVSEYTKKTIIDHYNISPEKIEVIYEGVDTKKYYPLLNKNSEKQIELKNLGIKRKYILYVGKIERRKNLVNLIKSYNSVRKNYAEEVDLVIVGKKGQKWQEVYNAKEKSPYSANIKIIGFVSETLLTLLYQNASLFVYPSLFEGFGLPPLEAMSCGIPVLVQNGTSLPEVVGTGGIMTDCTNEITLSDSILSILSNDLLQQELKLKAISYAKKFTWKKTAEKTIALYDKIYLSK